MKYQNITIFKNKNANTWYARYRFEGAQHYISGKTQQIVYDRLKVALSKNKAKTNRYTLKSWIEKWYQLYKQKLRERSLIDLKKITYKVPAHLIKKDIRFITSIDLSEHLASIKSNRVRAKTYTVLNDVFDKALKNDVITKNPFNVIDKPKYKPEERYALSESEENLLLDKIKGHNEFYIFAIAVLQGLRPGELVALEYSDLDFENMTISITKSIDELTDDIDVKNEYSNRTIPLFSKTYEIIKDIKPAPNGRLTTHNASTLNDKLKVLVGDITKEKITLYNLRHTFITRLGDKNVPEHIIQTWAGQQIGSTVTKGTYTHVSKETEIKYINILNK